MDDSQVTIFRKILENFEKRLETVEKVNIVQNKIYNGCLIKNCNSLNSHIINGALRRAQAITCFNKLNERAKKVRQKSETKK